VSAVTRLRRRRGLKAARAAGTARLLALDLETTGLDATAEMIAVGMVPVVAGRIQLGLAWSSLVAPTRPSAAGIVAHQLRPCELDAAPAPGGVLDRVLAQLAEADGLLVHHAALDVTVLRRSCAATGRVWPDPPVLDTMELLERMARREAVMGGPSVPRDLVGARRTLGLPAHPAHDPLADAVATAELYLAVETRLGGSPG
jgi:DNA polymerase-3 subunit epsilon